MLDIITISTKGQVVIPKNLRKDADLNRHDKILVVSDKGRIILEKISEKEIKEKMGNLLNYFSQKFKERGITKADIDKEIKAVRKNA